MSRRKVQQGIQSIEVGARLLEALARAAQPQMLRDLAAAADMPPAKAHRYLVSFARMGLVEQHPESGLYDLGSFALELGLSALGRLDPVGLAAPMLRDLCQETGQTAALAVWANQGATIVRWLGADTPVAASLRVGSVMPLTRSATGGAFAAFLPEEMTSSRVRKELADNARKGLPPTTPDELERTLARARRQGFTHTSELIPGISGIAAPVLDHSGAMVLAVIVLGYTKPFEANLDAISATLLRKAAALSSRLGWRPAA